MNRISLLIKRLYALSVMAHISHVNAKTYAQHEAIGSFYGAVDAIKDRLIEYLMGSDKIAQVSVDTINLEADLVSVASSVSDELCSLGDLLEDEAVKNIAAEMEESVGKLKYLLKLK